MKKRIIIAMILFFIMNVFNNFGHPVTPSFVRALHIPEVFFGIFYATMSLGLMFAAPIWGGFGDHGKNKLSIGLGLFIYALAQLGFAFSHNPYLMVFFRFIAGIGIAAPMTLFVSLIISYSKENRVKNLAILSALSTLGASLGYQVGGLLGDSTWFQALIPTTSYENVFIVQFISMALLSLTVLLSVKELDSNGIVSNRRSPFSSLSKIKTLDFRLIIFLLSLTLITMGSTNLSKYIDVYFDDLGYSTTTLGNFVMVTGIVSVITAVFIVPFVSKFKRQLAFIVILQVLSALIVFFVFRANNFILVIYTVYNIYVVIKAIYLPLEQNYISKHADKDSIGTITGIRQSFVSIGNVIGPLFGGIVYSIKPLVLFDSSAILFILGATLLVFILKSDNKKIEVESLWILN